MKTYTPLLLLLWAVLPQSLFSQNAELSSVLKDLSDNIQSVEAKKYSYGQEFTWDENRPHQIRFESSRSSEKGKTVTLEQHFNLRYLDPKSIRRDNVKDLLVVRAIIKGKDKFIKNIKDGKLDKYNNEVEFIANDVDNARAIQELLEKAIPIAEALPTEYAVPTDFDSQLKWLMEHTRTVEIGEETIEQKMEREEKQLTRLVFESVSQGKKGTDTEQWAFNLIDIAPKSTKLKVDKTKLYVNVETEDGKNYIRYLQKTKLENYKKNFKIYVDNVEKGEALATAIGQLAAESEKRFSNKSTTSASLSELIKDVEINGDQYKQSVSQEDCQMRLSSGYSKKEEAITDEYLVHLADLDPRSVKIDVSKTTVKVTAKVIKKEKLVQQLRNGEPENFNNELEIRANGIENARVLLDALPEAIKNCKGKNDCSPASGDANAVMTAVAAQLSDIQIKSNLYQQSLQPVDDNPGQWEYIRTEDNGKKSKQETFIFNVADLNLKAIKYKMGKQAIGITFQTKNKEEIIKYLVDDKADDYEKEMEWLVKDVAGMREVICGMEGIGD